MGIHSQVTSDIKRWLDFPRLSDLNQERTHIISSVLLYCGVIVLIPSRCVRIQTWAAEALRLTLELVKVKPRNRVKQGPAHIQQADVWGYFWSIFKYYIQIIKFNFVKCESWCSFKSPESAKLLISLIQQSYYSISDGFTAKAMPY